jgi:ribosomal protein L40E
MAVSEARAQAQFAAKKRCRVCNSSNPLAAQSCDICGSTFETAQTSSTISAAATVAAPTAAKTQTAPAATTTATVTATRKSAGTTATASTAPQRTPTTTPVRKASNGQSAASATASAPKPKPAARQNSRDAALAQFLRGDDAAAVVPEPSYAPMMAWVIVSFVVLVIAVVATAVILTNSTVKNETPTGAIPNSTRTNLAAMPSRPVANHAWVTVAVSRPGDRAIG